MEKIKHEDWSRWQRETWHTFANFHGKGGSGEIAINGVGNCRVVYNGNLQYEGNDAAFALDKYNSILEVASQITKTKP